MSATRVPKANRPPTPQKVANLRATFTQYEVTLRGKTARSLAVLQPATVEKVGEFARNLGVCEVVLSQAAALRIERIDPNRITLTDLAACVKAVGPEGKQELVLDLDSLQQVKRNPFKILRTIAMDVFMLTFPKLGRKVANKKYSFAFCVHPRKFQDVINGFPMIKIVPNIFGLREAVLKRLPPFRLSEITLNGETGILMCVGWDRGMFEKSEIKHEAQVEKNKKQENDLNQAQKKIVRMAVLAKRWGVEYIGLGALLPRYSNYGYCLHPGEQDKITKDQEEIAGLTVTTGHAYTVLVISKMVNKLRETILAVRAEKKPSVPAKEPIVAIVGAAGSTGACSARKAAADGARNILLVDMEKKTKVARLDSLKKELEGIYEGLTVEISTSVEALKGADIVVVVSSAPNVIIKSEHLKDGCFVVDDTQPVNVCPQISIERKGHVQVLKVLAPVKGIFPRYRFDRHTPLTDYVFTCLADLIMRVKTTLKKDTIGAVELEAVEELDRVTAENEIHVFGEDDFFGLGQEKVSIEDIKAIALFAA
ncbi:hypothetical protein A2291_00905 [candidate division WOR-1 bacterium RIFOXYB2_FULL_42_35]|uniref:Quinate/shikimate 5-dehydrogenase/glutamyl-tRNA reductase domain-containing protein n=1 Tax=candidate division WOR-1 bacterium RIFOXYC2_FULL_41_25 TaxID=1802586 RepID=A0A1F4TLI5_UNCSA|nr:MAG: hypothetical protein A2247_05890 [candidate division WOR-1 bacterium RIFOXYA2_FULL_41_14]OGC23614.1 MAG: hypothetical protein A2291_00905 [candidate division WOR-1 bacterium RIFOXYB2_FULL_42_35]OGC33578.1 MAG: hypothetical protein A2462_02720 [candidate division WOR-1 bacterium RIFOXYC2_FULL_41_25]OGC41744.1 MAG: hypothetical protein A2548_03265 [candidate division WOR-1 bacterium RIFOXYD2_FULL_41_8]